MANARYNRIKIEIERSQIDSLPWGTEIAVSRSCESLPSSSHQFLCRNVTKRGYYFHHGLYLGNERIIHFYGENMDSRNAKITVSSVEEFLGPSDENCSIYVVKYKNNEVVSRECETFQRVNDVLANPVLFGEYDVEKNNCETFTTWLKTGTKRSIQAESGKKQIMDTLFWAGVFLFLSWQIYKKISR